MKNQITHYSLLLVENTQEHKDSMINCSDIQEVYKNILKAKKDVDEKKQGIVVNVLFMSGDYKIMDFVVFSLNPDSDFDEADIFEKLMEKKNK